MYEYVKIKKNACTFMQVRPQQILVEKHLEGLGFKLQDKGKKTATILLAAKYENYRQLLALAHYSLRLSSYFVFEQCFAYLVAGRCVKEPLTLNQIYD